MNNIAISTDQMFGHANVRTNFNDAYFPLHKLLLEQGAKVPSRNGDTIEVLNFSTHVQKPYYRCIGGYGRNPNIFFLLAEALWIWAGRRDVAFLDTYNSMLKRYSDDGKVFHAPYGYRLRRWGKVTETIQPDEFGGSQDQILQAINLLANNPEDRRVVCSIWNPALDMAATTKDTPCNDMVMFKVRDGKLHATIANRSNDLSLGLTTNLFQFSFMLELMANILGLEVGSQTHNSQSLHLYTSENDNTNNKLTSELYSRINESPNAYKLYDACQPMRFDIPFAGYNVDLNIAAVDYHIASMITMLKKKAYNNKCEEADLLDEADYVNGQLQGFCEPLWYVYKLLAIYVEYKQDKDRTSAKHHALNKILQLQPAFNNTDMFMLAANFFVTRIKAEGGKVDGLLNGYTTPLQQEIIGTL